jgi:hypothetical protein
MSSNPKVVGGSMRSSNAGQADDKRLKLGQAFDPRNNALNAWRLVGHDVGDAGGQSRCWWLACGGRMRSMVAEVDVPDFECLGTLGI